MSEELKAQIQSVLAEAGYAPKASDSQPPPAAAAQAAAPAIDIAKLADEVAKRLAPPAADPLADALKNLAGTPAAPTYVSPPGAPNSPADVIENNPAKWDPAYIERLKRDGTFRQRVEEFHRVGQGGLFRKGGK